MKETDASHSYEHIRSEVVRAGAGAGKTTRLTHKVLQLVQDFYREHERFPRVVVTTFTRKATQELRERLTLLAREKKSPLLMEFVNSSSSLHISTIHGVLNILLTRYGHCVGMESAFRFISLKQETKDIRRIVRDLLLENNQYQNLLEAYSFNDLCSLLKKFYENKNQFSKNFKPYSMKDLEEISNKRVQNIAKKLKEASLSICAETSKEKWLEYSEFLNNLSCKMQKSSWENIEETLKIIEFPRRPSNNKVNPDVSEETIELCKEAVDKCKGKGSESLLGDSFNRDLWLKYLNISALIEDLGSEFGKKWHYLKWKSAKITMSDLEILALQLVRQSPKVAEKFSSEWDYWLIDEYQDTSPLQVELLQKLVGSRPSFIVGDPQQSIYLFRGARSEVFFSKEKEGRESGADIDFLKRNYRSEPELLMFFNDFFTRLGPQFRSMEPYIKENKKNDLEKVVARFIQVNSENENGEKEDLEPFAVARQVGNLLKQGIEADQICILARTNRQLEKVAQYLQKCNYPVQIHSSGGFYKRREIRDALCFLKFLVNPHDNLNLLSILRSPWFKVLDSSISYSLQGKPSNYYEFFKKNFLEDDRWEGFCRLQKWRSLSESEGILSVFEKGIIESGMIDFSHRYDVTGRRESNIWKLICRLRQESSMPCFNFLSFVNQQEIQLSLDRGDEGDAVAAWEPHRVNLMTIHASKGLQFDYVLLPYLSQSPQIARLSHFSCDEDSQKGKWTLAVPFGDDDKITHTIAGQELLKSLQKRELQEADRVLYVALTRAKKGVSLFFKNKIAKNSWMSRIRWDLTPGIHSTPHYSFEVFYDQESSFSQPINIEKKSFDVPKKCSYWQDEELVLPGVTSVTEMLKDDEGQNYRGQNVSQFIEKAQQGTILHRIFESIHYQGIQTAREMIEKWFPHDVETLQQSLDYITQVQSPNLLEIIETGNTEWGFLCQVDGQVIEGQIDLWGRHKDEIWVVDYKTGSLRYKNKAFEQLKIYGKVLRNSGLLKKEDQISLAVIYPLLGETEIQPFLEGPS